jgi:hypothetical protein
VCRSDHGEHRTGGDTGRVAGHRGGVVGNQPFDWPRPFVWIALCLLVMPVGGLVGLAMVIFMILALAELVPTM